MKPLSASSRCLRVNPPTQEYFCDYSPLTSSHFSLSILPTPLHPAPNQRVMPLYGDSPQTFSPHSSVFQRHLEGLTSVLLSLKKRPIIRYERMSPMARRLGQELVYQMNQGQPDLWEFRKTATAPLLLILDRRNDPVTPLLTQWTYQAMVHELLGITNGRVSLADAPDVRDELKVRSSALVLRSASAHVLVKPSGDCPLARARPVLRREPVRQLWRPRRAPLGIRAGLLDSVG